MGGQETKLLTFSMHTIHGIMTLHWNKFLRPFPCRSHHRIPPKISLMIFFCDRDEDKRLALLRRSGLLFQAARMTKLNNCL